MKHYFTDNTDLKSEQSQFIFRFHKYDLLFTSDNGVFSKNMIDYGSRVLLDNIEITNEKTLLDVGCGYGTFGICLNKVYSHLNVDMVDVNDRALELAKLNAKNNNIHANIYKSFIYENVQGSYDVIVTITGIVLVFLILVLLMAIITLEGKIFDAMNGKKAAAKVASAAKPAAPVKQAAAPAPAKAAAPQVEAGIPGDVVAAIMAAIYSMGNGKYVLKAVRRGKNGWGKAGVNDTTAPF